MNNTRNASMLGTLYCVFAALAYAVYSVSLRYVSDKQDSAWINCVQASVGAAIFGAYLAWRAARGRRALPPWKETLILAALGLITQLGGVLMIWAMSVVGVGVTATLQTGVMLAASALLGRIVLGERVSWRHAAAIVMITVSVVFFSTAAPGHNALTPLRGLLGIAAGVVSGLAIAVLYVGIRKTVTANTAPEAVVFLISIVGVAALGPWCIYRLGVDKLIHTPLEHIAIMLRAGFMNMVGFALITKSLQLIAVVRVNVINNGLYTALNVLAGILLFSEPWDRNIMLGIMLSIAGILLISLAGPAKNADTA